MNNQLSEQSLFYILSDIRIKLILPYDSGFA